MLFTLGIWLYAASLYFADQGNGWMMLVCIVLGTFAIMRSNRGIA